MNAKFSVMLLEHGKSLFHTVLRVLGQGSANDSVSFPTSSKTLAKAFAGQKARETKSSRRPSKVSLLISHPRQRKVPVRRRQPAGRQGRPPVRPCMGKTAYGIERGYCLVEIGRRQKGKTRPFDLQRGRLMPILKKKGGECW